jgi:hypothetical protein
MGNEAFCLEEKAMTPSAEKIQRWEVFDGGVNACWVGETTDGPYVLHSDHLAALEDARMEAGERVKRELRKLLGIPCYSCDHYEMIHARLAELEREGA